MHSLLPTFHLRLTLFSERSSVRSTDHFKVCQATDINTSNDSYSVCDFVNQLRTAWQMNQASLPTSQGYP